MSVNFDIREPLGDQQPLPTAEPSFISQLGSAALDFLCALANGLLAILTAPFYLACYCCSSNPSQERSIVPLNEQAPQVETAIQQDNSIAQRLYNFLHSDSTQERSIAPLNEQAPQVEVAPSSAPQVETSFQKESRIAQLQIEGAPLQQALRAFTKNVNVYLCDEEILKKTLDDLDPKCNKLEAIVKQIKAIAPTHDIIKDYEKTIREFDIASTRQAPLRQYRDDITDELINIDSI